MSVTSSGADARRAGHDHTGPSTPAVDPSAGNDASAQDRSGANEGAGAWLLLAVGEDRAFGSNDGYADEPETHYRWDDTVPNHARVREGDPVVLWDKKASIGVAVVESIETMENTKPVYSCPHCGRAHIKARKTKQPRYRCFACGEDFDIPNTQRKKVLEYTAGYASSYVDLGGLLDGAALRALCVSPKSQLSLRPLDWARFRHAVARAGGSELLTVVEASKSTTAGGHRQAHVRVRIGQGAFRRGLLATTGPVCAFTGSAPPEVLEAAHLYSYARVGEHREHGGLLMRRDLHRLFDLGFIAVDPRTLTIDVAASLDDYPAYTALRGRRLAVTPKKRQIEWLREHWREHRTDAI